MIKKEKVARTMQMSMMEAGRDETLAEENKMKGDGTLEVHEEGNNVPSPQAPAEENEKEGDGPIEAHKGGDNVQSPQADQREVINKVPGAAVVEEPSEGTQEDPQSPGRGLPRGL